MTKIQTILEQLKFLTMSETMELVKLIEQTFDIDASLGSGIAMTSTVPVSNVEEVEEKTEFNLILVEVPADKKIAILKVVRSITGLGLKDAKDLVEAAPKLVKEGMSKEAAELAKKQLEETGAKIDIQ